MLLLLTGSQQSVSKLVTGHFLMEKEYPGSGGHGWQVEGTNTNENDKRTTEEPVITPVFEEANSLTGGLLQVNDNSNGSEIDCKENI